MPLRTILVATTVVALFYLAGKLAFRLRDILLLVVLAGFFAGLLSPVVNALQRRRIKRRGLAVTVVTACALVVFIALAFAFGVPLAHGTAHLAHSLPAYVNSVEHGRGWLGHLARKYHLQNWVHENTSKIVNLGQGLTKPALSLGRGAANVVLALVTVFILVIMLLLEGPGIWAGLLGGMAPDRAQRYSRIAREAQQSAAGYMLGNLLTSLTAGVVVLVTLMATGVPYPFLWALWVALVDFLPMVGGALAGIPTVLFAVGHSLVAGIITLVVFLVYTQIENHILNPIVMSRTVRVNPLLVLLSVLVAGSIGAWIGGTFGAFVAAILAIPAAAAIQIVVRDAWRSTAPGSSRPHP